jgi:hypothetical protein
MSLRYRLLLLLVVGLVCLGGLPARAEQFVTGITLNTKRTQNGKIVTVRQTKGALLNLAAEFAGVEARTLELVYDTDTDAISVVRKSDGGVVLPQLAFTGGLTLANTVDTVRQRQTFVKFQGSANVSGSAVGRIEIARNADLSFKRFLWTGSVQLNQPAGLFNPDLIITGFFTTGRRFTPTGP